MVNYSCNNCGKIFSQKCHYINHTKKKKYPCEQINTNPQKIHTKTENSIIIPQNSINLQCSLPDGKSILN